MKDDDKSSLAKSLPETKGQYALVIPWQSQLYTSKLQNTQAYFIPLYRGHASIVCVYRAQMVLKSYNKIIAML